MGLLRFTFLPECEYLVPVLVIVLFKALLPATFYLQGHWFFIPPNTHNLQLQFINTIFLKSTTRVDVNNNPSQLNLFLITFR